MPRVEISYPGDTVVKSFTALVRQPVSPTSAPPIDIGLVEISTPAIQVPGPPGPPGPGVVISDTPPPNPVDGDLWWESDTAILWAWYIDPDGSGTWVQISGGVGGPDSDQQLHVTPQMFGAVGDGVANDTAAFNAALAVTGDIYIPSGVYLVNELTIPSNTRLSGARGKSIIRARAGTVGPLISGVPHSTDITIENLTLDCDGLATAGYYIEGSANRHQIIGCHIIDPTNTGVYLRTVKGATVADCIIDNSGLAGITLTTSIENFSIYGNNINNPGGAGIIFSVGSYGSIHGNVVVGGGPSGDGITGYHDLNRFVSITNNTIRDSQNHGIHVGGQHIVISGNTIENSTLNEGLYLGAFQNGSSGTGIKTISRNCIINGNTVLNTARSGILCDRVEDSVISNNQCKTSGIQGAKFLQSHRNVIIGNLLIDNVGGGLLLSGSQNNDITGNRTANSGGDGYRFDVDGAVNSTGNSITNNRSVSDNRGFVEATSGTNLNVFTKNRATSSTSLAFVKQGVNSIFDNIPREANVDYDPISLAIGASATTTIAVAGANLGDLVQVGFAKDLSDVLLYGWVSAVDTVTVRFYNVSGGVRDLAAANLRVRVTEVTT